MTDKQTAYYRSLWNKARKARAWGMHSGRLRNAEPLPVTQATPEPEIALSVVLATAEMLARKQHRAPNVRDIRIACHHVAVGRACSSDDLTGKEFTRVKALLQVLADPLDLGALNEWLHPELDDRRRLEHRIAETHQHEAVIRAISENACGTRDWETLDTPDLARLALILEQKSRKAA